MLFHSGPFLFGFLPAVLFGYFIAHRVRGNAALVWLIAASLFFYGWWNPAYLWVIIASVVFNFAAGLLLRAKRKLWLLIAAIGANLVMLGYFKYLGFFTEIASSLLHEDLRLGAIILPLGISFFTFQQISYLVDAYNGRTKTNTFVEYALFVTFFPHLIAGPIVHHLEILPQLVAMKNSKSLAKYDLAVGLAMFLVGLFKKAVIADHLDSYTVPMFAAAEDQAVALTFVEAWSGALSYALQIYFDFSGYSDMAIGLARLFGIRFPVNFESPFKASSMIDFWQRWHITMTRFFMGYVYNPIVAHLVRLRAARGLATSQRILATPGPFVTLVAGPILLTMFLVGLWHGGAWKFVAFGLLHGIYLIVNHAWRLVKSRMDGKVGASSVFARIFSWGLTFAAVVVGFVLFRAQTLTGATNVILGMTGLNGRLALANFNGLPELGWIAVGLIIVLALPTTQWWAAKMTAFCDSLTSSGDAKQGRQFAVDALLFFSLGFAYMAILPFFSKVEVQPFIYFQF